MLAANEKARPDPRLGGLFSASRQLRPRLPLTGSLNSSESGNSEEKDHARHRHRPQTASRNRGPEPQQRSEEHTSELQSLMRNSYAVFCLKQQNKITQYTARISSTSHEKLQVIDHINTTIRATINQMNYVSENK